VTTFWFCPIKTLI